MFIFVICNRTKSSTKILSWYLIFFKGSLIISHFSFFFWTKKVCKNRNVWDEKKIQSIVVLGKLTFFAIHFFVKVNAWHFMLIGWYTVSQKKSKNSTDKIIWLLVVSRLYNIKAKINIFLRKKNHEWRFFFLRSLAHWCVITIKEYMQRHYCHQLSCQI